MSSLFLGIDQGTSGSRALLLDDLGLIRGYGYRPLERLYPHSGWVEQNPHTVACGVAEAITDALGQAHCQPQDIRAAGIACQRNTLFAWDAQTRQPLGHAITWQDLRTLPLVAELEAWRLKTETRTRLGYPTRTYQGSLHLKWRMRHDQEFARAARDGSLRVGLSALWVLNALGHAHTHAMDYGLVQAQGVFDFRAGTYWSDWLDWLGVPPGLFPQPRPSTYEYGSLRITAPNGVSGDVPVWAMLGDQQAALFGYDCRAEGEAECTHGTASFVDVCVGDHAPHSESLNVYHAWSLPTLADIAHTYCLEADTTVTGAGVRWLRENLRILEREDELGTLAASVPDAGGVVFVPAFTGLNVPYNDSYARGTLIGLTLSTTRAHIARAFLDSIGHQLRAILDTIRAETGVQVTTLKVGGGLSASDLACQIQSDLLGIPVMRPASTETTARATALLAGLGVGAWPALSALPKLSGPTTSFEPTLSADQRQAEFARWQKAVQVTQVWSGTDR